jgi:hypothetical protein
LIEMPDRLAELVRQRALLHEHLAWLNKEIDEAARGRSGVTAPNLAMERMATPLHAPAEATPSVAAAAATPSPATAQTSPTTEDIFAEYRVAPATMKDNVRKGCLLYFVAGLGLLFVVVTILYFALRST